MDQITQARTLLGALGMPPRQQADLCALALLALAGLRPGEAWSAATNSWLRVHDIIQWANSHYGTTYAENSRETFRKQALHHFRTAALVEDNGKATNSPHYRWRLTEELLHVCQAYGTPHEGQTRLADFLSRHQSLAERYASRRLMAKIPVRIGGEDITFGPGLHNRLQKAIIEEFAPRFAPGAECLYVGDTERKDLVRRDDRLRELGFQITLHDKMPDVVLYSAERNWIYFVEAVTSVGPMDPKRLGELAAMTAGCVAGKIFVTAFLDLKTYRRFASQLAWETEVWLADAPDHMIHLNGDRFLGPR